MSLINITKRNAPLEVSHEVALKIKNRKFGLNGQAKALANDEIDLGRWAGTYGEIRSVEITSGLNSENNKHEEVDSQYRRDLMSFRKLSPQNKSKRLGFFRLLYWGFTGKNSEEVMLKNGVSLEAKATAIQEKFFAENSKRMFCDLLLFRPLIKSEKCQDSIMRILENQIRQDVFSGKYL